MAAILGSCPRSLDKVASGIRCWLDFHENVYGDELRAFPPTIEALLAWSCTFRCSGTFQNYLGHVKTGCQLFSLPTTACEDPVVARAVVAIKKRELFESRPKMFVRLKQVEQLAKLAKLEDGEFGELFF